ncbi:hypothetical protein Scep_024880 [Stephania cephalantha]|uniref:(S)-coclaurine-N-methyltransferase n=1 Tax=Stephania cephalantha TaxID=152367 RepID=A0AAP0F055_9MAGN
MGGTNCEAEAEAPQRNRAEVTEVMRKLGLGLIPDEELRSLISVQVERRLRWGYKPTFEQQLAQLVQFAHSLKQMPISLEAEVLESQVYEIPNSFMKLLHGSSMKASWCFFINDSTTLDEAEIAMLELYCDRSQIRDGDRVLDLGCGFGALATYIARKYPNCQVTGVTNSEFQKEFIEEQCKKDNLVNVEVILADVTTHEMDKEFDRVMAIGVIEHMKNYKLLLKKISKWMKQDGLLFVDHICHKAFAYHFEPIGEEDWIEEYIFPGGVMTIPSADLLLYFQDDISVVNHWTVNGKHYSRTNEEWLKRLDGNADAARAILEDSLGSKEEAMKMLNYWRTFCLYGMELCKYNNGEEWMSAHVLFKKK